MKKTPVRWTGVFFIRCRAFCAYERRVIPTSAARWELRPCAAGGRNSRTAITAAAPFAGGSRCLPANGKCGKAARRDNPEVVGSNPSPATIKEIYFVCQDKRSLLLLYRSAYGILGSINRDLRGEEMDTNNEDFWKALDELVNNSDIIIDRPKGTAHPKYPDFIYKVDYGYLKETSSMDGTGIDVWVGSGEKKINAIMCIVDLNKKDSEIKILIGCTEEEKEMVYETHNETPFMKGVLIRR